MRIVRDIFTRVPFLTRSGSYPRVSSLSRMSCGRIPRARAALCTRPGQFVVHEGHVQFRVHVGSGFSAWSGLGWNHANLAIGSVGSMGLESGISRWLRYVQGTSGVV